MIGKGAGKVGGVSLGLRTTFVALSKLRDFGRVARCNPNEFGCKASFPDTALATNLLTYDHETQTCKDLGTANFARALHGRAPFRQA